MKEHYLTNALRRALRRVRLHVLISTLLPVVMPSMGLAQDTNVVTLRFANDQESISGNLTDFRDGKFFIESSIGLLAIPVDGVSCVGAACPEGTSLRIANAQVVLTAKNGSVTLAGDLIEIRDNEYVIATLVGEQRIAVDLVDCAGEGCPPASENPVSDGIVELTNGDVTLRGRLVGFEGDSYLLDVDLMGVIRFNASQFECLGASCP